MVMIISNTLPISAKLDEFDKSSYSYYLDDKLVCKEKTVLTFDDPKDFDGAVSVPGIKDGAIGFKSEKDRSKWQIINTDTGTFKLSVENIFRQTVKLRVYVNDIDLIGCDHDAVYDTPQVGSGTLYITLSSKKDGIGHVWQHTFYGSGWHDIELSFLCHNVAYNNLSRIDYNNLTSLNIWCIAKEGLELRFDDMRFCTYDNPQYTRPKAPYGGKWLSTCDYDALDGANLTEWYGSSFDTENKTQGSSSLRITGHKENVDHRVCIGVKHVLVNYMEDSFCFDMYVNDPELLGENWQIRLEHNAQAAHYSMNYKIMTDNIVDENMSKTELKKGWNHFQIPFKEMTVKIGKGYEDKFNNNLVLTQLMFFIEGTGTNDNENYIINYDNFYIAKTADILAADITEAQETDAADTSSSTTSSLSPENTDSLSSASSSSGFAKTLSIAIVPIALAAVAAIIVSVAVKKARKKKN